MNFRLSLFAFSVFSVSALADGPVRHVVHFKFSTEATAEQIQRVVDEFAKLPSKIDLIESFEWGTNSSPEGLDKGFTHCWVISFRTSKDRDAYLKHPEHDAFVKIAKPILADVHVVDFVPHWK
jgi:hypothetical protein